MTPIRLLIIEDQQLVQQSIVSALRERLPLELAGAYLSGRAALTAPEALRQADVALIDICLGEEQIFESLPEIRRINPSLKLIWMTAVQAEFLFARALELNLEGFVHKNDPIAVLVTAVERVSAGHRFMSASVLEMDARFRRQSDHFKKLLSPREQEILGVLGQGLANEEAAALLGLSAGTIQAHRRNIMARIGAHSAAELQTYALQRGFTTPERLRTPEA